MTLIRVTHNKNYTTINNTITRDARLSWKAKGIFFYAFSRPDDWSFYVSDLVKQSKDGEDSVRSGLNELQQCGYLRIFRNRDDKGRIIECIWIFYETPTTPDIEGHPSEPYKNTPTTTCEPERDFPVLDNPRLDNPALLSTDIKQVLKAANKGAAPPVPPAAAASFQKSNQEKQQAGTKQPPPPPPPAKPQMQLKKRGIINPILADTPMPDIDKIWISERYDDVTIRNALEWIKTKGSVGSYPAMFKFGCEHRLKPEKKASECADDNKAYAAQFGNLMHDGVRVMVLNKAVEFDFGYSACPLREPVCLSYDQKGFKEKFDELVAKFKIKAR